MLVFFLLSHPSCAPGVVAPHFITSRDSFNGWIFRALLREKSKKTDSILLYTSRAVCAEWWEGEITYQR